MLTIKTFCKKLDIFIQFYYIFLKKETLKGWIWKTQEGLVGEIDGVTFFKAQKNPSFAVLLDFGIELTPCVAHEVMKQTTLYAVLKSFGDAVFGKMGHALYKIMFSTMCLQPLSYTSQLRIVG